MTAKICSICHTPIPSGAPGGFCPACVLRGADESIFAATPGGPPLQEVRAAFPQLEVQALIGQGGMGFVYKARQPSLDRTVALKILAPALGRDPAFAERFAREARVLAKLSHPNIVAVFEHGVTQPSSPGAQPFYYLLMEYVDGVNLRQAMRAGRFTPEQALSVVPGICDALQAAHAQGIWHRDIKPENILLDARGGLKIADFGIARLVGDPARDFTITVTGAALGSAAYMAPEQHERPHDVDHRADIYSLGVVIYEMLTGELPLGRFPAPSQRAAVDARIDEIVFRTLEKERALRQQSAEEVKTEVTRATSYPPRAHPAPARSWTPLILSQMAVVAGIVLFGGAAALTHGSTQNTLLTLSLVPFVLGLVGLFLFRRREPPRMQKRHFSMGLVAGALLAGITVAVVAIIEYNNTARALAKANLAEEREKLSALKAAAERQADKTGGLGDAPVNTDTPVINDTPVLPSTPASAAKPLPASDDMDVLKVVRKMNTLASELNVTEFRKYAPERKGLFAINRPVAETMQEFAGELLGAWIVSLKEPASAALGLVTKGGSAKVVVQIRARSGSTSWKVLHFEALKEGWKYKFSSPPVWRSTARLEFRPDQGDPLTLFGAHTDKHLGFAAVKDEPGVFEIWTESEGEEDSAPGRAQSILQNELLQLTVRLKRSGLDGALTVLTQPALPVRPAAAGTSATAPESGAESQEKK